MKLHFALAAAMTLCACSNVSAPANQAPSYDSGYAPVAFAPPPSFCEDVAVNDRLRALRSGFDLSTIDRIATQSLQQCRSLLAMSPDTNAPALRVVSAAQ